MVDTKPHGISTLRHQTKNPTKFSKGRLFNVEIVRLKMNSEVQNEAAKVRNEMGIVFFFSHHRLL